MILGRNLYKNIKIGCCGMSRYDIIFPIGYTTTESAFKEDAKQMIEDYYKSDYDGGNDCYSLEYFEGDADQTQRGGGTSLFKCELINDEWIYN